MNVSILSGQVGILALTGLLGCGGQATTDAPTLAVALSCKQGCQSWNADPGDIVLFVGDHARSCAEPMGIGSPCPEWHAEMRLPAADQQAGAQLKLSDLQATIAISTAVTIGTGTGTDTSAGTLCVETSKMLTGNLELLSIDDHALKVTFSAVSPEDFDPQGEYDAIRCP